MMPKGNCQKSSKVDKSGLNFGKFHKFMKGRSNLKTKLGTIANTSTWSKYDSNIPCMQWRRFVVDMGDGDGEKKCVSVGNTAIFIHILKLRARRGANVSLLK